MKLELQSTNLDDYLTEIPPLVTYSTPAVEAQISVIKSQASTDYDRAKLSFEIVRDDIAHNFDTKSDKVCTYAEDVLRNKEGICFAKSHLLASLLRGLGIPAGFCYQRVLKKGTVRSGYALHGLNALYLPKIGWFRVDPRGNKPGVNAQFSITEEKLAYPIRTELGEVDYNMIFTAPLESVVEAMKSSKNCQELFETRPEEI